MVRAGRCTDRTTDMVQRLMQYAGLALTAATLVCAGLAFMAPTQPTALGFSLAIVVFQVLAIACFLKSSR